VHTLVDVLVTKTEGILREDIRTFYISPLLVYRGKEPNMRYFFFFNIIQYVNHSTLFTAENERYLRKHSTYSVMFINIFCRSIVQKVCEHFTFL
jgi:hypothetical protein